MSKFQQIVREEVARQLHTMTSAAQLSKKAVVKKAVVKKAVVKKDRKSLDITQKEIKLIQLLRSKKGRECMWPKINTVCEMCGFPVRKVRAREQYCKNHNLIEK